MRFIVVTTEEDGSHKAYGPWNKYETAETFANEYEADSPPAECEVLPLLSPIMRKIDKIKKEARKANEK